jgi:hypothetical protein
VKVLVIHYTADDFDVSLATLTDNQVSSHYLIPEQPPLYQGKPRIWQLVPEQDLAWHAGISFWRGSTRINDTSIGIELENRGWQKSAGVKSFTPFNPAQINALIPLAKDIIPATTLRRKTWLPTPILPRSVRTTPGRYSHGGSWPGKVLARGRMPVGWRFISTVGHRINRLIALNCWIRSLAMAIRSRRR